MAFPIPIQTNHGVVHLYYKYQRPIIGTWMAKSRHVIIIVTETKKYCGFLSEEGHVIKKYKGSTARIKGDVYTYFREDGTLGLTENELVRYPFEDARPFNLNINMDYVIPIIYINYVSSLVQHYNNGYTGEYITFEKCPIPLKDLTMSFQLKAYEYDNYNQATDVINTHTFENDPKLEYMLKMVWKIEHGIENLPIRALGHQDALHNEPPKYENEESHTQSSING